MGSEDCFGCFLSLWVLRIVLCVFVSMGSEDCFVCFFSLWVLVIVLWFFFYIGSEDCFVCFRNKNKQNNHQKPYRQKRTKQSAEPIETKTHKILSIWVLRIVLCAFFSMGSEDYFVCFCLYWFWGLFCVFFSQWVLRNILCVFVSMGSADCFVCFCLYEFWGLFCN
jgi:hypothetical protein